MHIVKKALLVSAFFISVYSITGSGYAEECIPPGVQQPIDPIRVLDGDTLEIRGQRRLRLAAVNTPEIHYGKAQPEPYALQAKQALERWIANADQIAWVEAQDAKDHYGRALGYLIIDGTSVAEQLVSQGLAWSIAIAPNLVISECLLRVEAQARAQRLGVWQQTPIAANTISQGGFVVTQGTITRVDQTAQFLFVEVDATLAIQIDLQLLSQDGFRASDFALGGQIEARGWVIDRRARLKKGSRYLGYLLKLTSLKGLAVH